MLHTKLNKWYYFAIDIPTIIEIQSFIADWMWASSGKPRLEMFPRPVRYRDWGSAAAPLKQFIRIIPQPPGQCCRPLYRDPSMSHKPTPPTTHQQQTIKSSKLLSQQKMSGPREQFQYWRLRRSAVALSKENYKIVRCGELDFSKWKSETKQAGHGSARTE